MKPHNTPMAANMAGMDAEASVRLYGINQELRELDDQLRQYLRRREALIKEANHCCENMEKLARDFESNREFVDNASPEPKTEFDPLDDSSFA